MAIKDKQAAETEVVSVYSRRELINAAKVIFETKPEIMAGALHGIEEPITVEKAKALLAAFKTKRVGDEKEVIN